MRASAFGWPRSVLPAWGEPARPGFPPEGETGKGAFQFLAAAGISFILVRRPHSRLCHYRSGPPGYHAPDHPKVVQRLLPHTTSALPTGRTTISGTVRSSVWELQ